MNHRQPPFARLVNGICGAVRSGYEALESLGASISSRRSENRAEGLVDGSDRFESATHSSAGATAAALVDADSGPTSRSELREQGCSPARYVRAVLAEHGGRVRQQRFVEEYGWTASTISRLLSDLEAQGVIERYRLSREKVVRLPEDA